MFRKLLIFPGNLYNIYIILVITPKCGLTKNFEAQLRMNIYIINLSRNFFIKLFQREPTIYSGKSKNNIVFGTTRTHS